MSRHVPDAVRRPMSGARSGALLWALCCAGREPAEALDTRDREDLVAELVARGWSVVEIAALTRMSTYTTARIAAPHRRRPRPHRGRGVSGTHTADGSQPWADTEETP